MFREVTSDVLYFVQFGVAVSSGKASCGVVAKKNTRTKITTFTKKSHRRKLKYMSTPPPNKPGGTQDNKALVMVLP